MFPTVTNDSPNIIQPYSKHAPMRLDHLQLRQLIQMANQRILRFRRRRRRPIKNWRFPHQNQHTVRKLY